MQEHVITSKPHWHAIIRRARLCYREVEPMNRAQEIQNRIQIELAMQRGFRAAGDSFEAELCDWRMDELMNELRDINEQESHA